MFNAVLLLMKKYSYFALIISLVKFSYSGATNKGEGNDFKVVPRSFIGYSAIITEQFQAYRFEWFIILLIQIKLIIFCYL